jgi:hypothetical protein
VLILAEGWNDEVFLKEIISNATHLSISPFFYSNNGIKTEKKDQETVMLRKYCSKNNYYNLFVKEEGGKDFVLRLFTNIVINFLVLHKDLCLIVLFDHDGRDPETEIQKIRNDLKAKTGSKIAFESSSPIHKISDGFNRRDFSLVQLRGTKSYDIASFSFATFDTSLEGVVSKHYSKPEEYLCNSDFKEFASTIDIKDIIPCLSE